MLEFVEWRWVLEKEGFRVGKRTPGALAPGVELAGCC